MERCDKRASVILAALELVGEHGFHGSPMALIAERAGVAAGTIYRYFESKDDLIRETYSWLEKEFLATAHERYPEERTVRERFLHIGQVLLTYFTQHPLNFQFLEQFHNSPYGAACRWDLIYGKQEKNFIAALFEEAREQQIIQDLPIPVLYDLFFGPLKYVCRDHIQQLIELSDELDARIVEACWNAVRR